ncbi:hypothetical protein [Mesorhizobium sp. CN2-181]|uniref:hypothetical protein n=1 Tax=Mesorhizobium yinganensis TaxID=3157707 RepID=UPI0032B7D909
MLGEFQRRFPDVDPVNPDIGASPGRFERNPSNPGADIQKCALERFTHLRVHVGDGIDACEDAFGSATHDLHRSGIKNLPV